MSYFLILNISAVKLQLLAAFHKGIHAGKDVLKNNAIIYILDKERDLHLLRPPCCCKLPDNCSLMIPSKFLKMVICHPVTSFVT